MRHDVAHLPSNCTPDGKVASATNPAKYGCGARTAGGLNVDTAGPANFPTLPTGSLPIYVPVETTGSVRFTDMEFVGYDTITLITQGVSAGVSIGTGTFLGIGAALFGKLPVPVNLSNVPVLWDKQSPTVQSVGGVDQCAHHEHGQPGAVEPVGSRPSGVHAGLRVDAHALGGARPGGGARGNADSGCRGLPTRRSRRR